MSSSEVVIAKREFRRTSFRLRFADMSLAARDTLDLFRFGSGRAERIVAAFCLAVLFFLAYLVVARAIGLGAGYGLVLGGTGLVISLGVTAALVVAGSDAEVENRRTVLASELREMRERLAELERTEPPPSHGDDFEPEPPRVAMPAMAWQVQSVAIPCPFCAEPVRAGAQECEHCGETLDVAARTAKAARRAAKEPTRPTMTFSNAGGASSNTSAATRPTFSPGAAAAFSFLIPGLGQLYKGEVMAAFGWWLFTGLGYLCCLIPGMIMHTLCIFSAASGGHR